MKDWLRLTKITIDSNKELNKMIITPEVYDLIYKMNRLMLWDPINPEIEFPKDIPFAEKVAIKAAAVSMQTILNVAKEEGI